MARCEGTMKKCATAPDLGAALLAAKPKPYRPAFSVSAKPEGWWICDGGRPIAFIHRESFSFDPFEFSPFRRLTPNPACHPRYDSASRNALCLTLPVNVIGNHMAPDKRADLRWAASSGARVEAVLDHEYANGVAAVTTLRIGYRPERAAYAYELDYEVREPLPFPRREFCNFYARGLGDGIPDQKKWQYTIWAGHDGRLWKMPHNSALTFAARLGNPYKRIAPGGFLGFGVEPDLNPAVLFTGSNLPLLSGTCDMWYDEHLSCEAPTLEGTCGNRGVARVSFEVVDVPAAAMRRLLARARRIPLSDEEAALRPCPPLVWNRVCDMEAPLDPRMPAAGMVFIPGSGRWLTVTARATGKPAPVAAAVAAGLSAWETGAGRSGKRFLALRCAAGRRTAWGPGGHAFHVKPGTAYRFEAWVRTAGKASASIVLANVWRKWHDVGVKAESESVSCRSWRKVSAVVTTTDYPYVYPTLVVEGAGTAHFDDLFIGPEPA